MEDEKKKKKNKKKKNKQPNKVADSVAVIAAESACAGVTDVGQTSNGQATETTDVETDLLQNAGRHLANGAQALSEAEKQYWLDREATLQEKIKQFQKEKDVQKEKEAMLEGKVEHLLKEREIIIQKEVSLQEKLQQLQNEKDANEEKRATLEDKIVQLHKEREAHMHKEAGLEERVRELHKEKDSLLLKEAEQEMKIMHLEGEKQSWLRKEAGLEEKIHQLLNEAATLSLKGVSLEEKIKQMERERDSWVQKENSIKEKIASLDGDNTKLRSKVMQLEELRDSLLQETQLLKECISGLQSHNQNLEKSTSIPSSLSRRHTEQYTSENGEINSGIDAAHMLVEKLMSENAELVEKVNELYVELDQRGPTAEASASITSHPESVTAGYAHVAESSPPAPNLSVEATKSHETGAVAELMLESSKKMSLQEEMIQSLEEVAIKDNRCIGDYLNESIVMTRASEMTESDEIVQIPLDENEIEVKSPETAYNEEVETEVPLADAPLIGAPFRLISFVARYVSGADLVNKTT